MRSSRLFVLLFVFVVIPAGCERDTDEGADEPAATDQDDEPIEPDLSVGDGVACAVDEAGALECHGEGVDDFSEIPDGSFRSVSVGPRHACAIDVEGAVSCWGREEVELPEFPGDVSYREVSTSYDTTCAIRRDNGSVECLGAGEGWDVPAGRFEQVSVADRHACALEADGRIECWGEDGTEITEVPSGEFQAVGATGFFMACWIDTDGDLECRDLRSGEVYFSPDKRFEQLNASSSSACGVDVENKARCEPFVVLSRENDFLEPPADSFERIAVGAYDVCGLDTGGNISCWGTSIGGDSGPPSQLKTYDIRPLDSGEVELADIGVHDALADSMDDGPLDDLFADDDAEFYGGTTDDDLEIGRGAGGLGIRGAGDGTDLGDVDTGSEETGTGADVDTGEPAVGDFCDTSNIQSVVESRRGAIQHCYERQLQTNPELAGNVTVNWRVELDGSTSNVMIAESTLNDQDVEACVVRNIERMMFDEPDGGMCDVNYPFVFSGLD